VRREVVDLRLVALRVVVRRVVFLFAAGLLPRGVAGLVPPWLFVVAIYLISGWDGTNRCL
jgi:hypothetical protein